MARISCSEKGQPEFGAGRSRRKRSAEMVPKELQVNPLLQLGNDVGPLLLEQSFQVGERISDAPIVQPTLVCAFFSSASRLRLAGHGNFSLVRSGVVARRMIRPPCDDRLSRCYPPFTVNAAEIRYARWKHLLTSHARMGAWVCQPYSSRQR